MAVLKIGKPEFFHLLGTKQLPPQKAFDFFKNQFKDMHYDWWFLLCLTGGGLIIEEGANYGSIMKDVGLLSDDQEFIPQRDLAEFFSGWGHRFSKSFGQIYEKIEQLYQWS